MEYVNLIVQIRITKVILSMFFGVMACRANPNSPVDNTLNQDDTKPNILWVVCEDISPTLSFYGDTTAKTPNLDALAAESLIYDNAFATVGVCAPARSSIITGMYPTSIGTVQMRTGQDVMSWGKRQYKDREDLGRDDIQGNPIRQYAAVIPSEVKCFTEYLRAKGYFCTNNEKTDYQFAAPVTAWDENNNKAHWRNRPLGKPFFSVFNFGVTHESRLWRNDTLPLTVEPGKVKVPPYLPDNQITRKTVARHYSNVELLDAQIGELIQKLKLDGLYDNTIIFFYSDHGGPLPRQKRAIYDSGLKVPFMVKGLDGKKGRTDRLISFIDLAPTLLSLVGAEPPKHMEGKAFMGKYEAAPRDYIHGSSDRFDEYTDRIRAVRNKRFLYVRNYFPELPKYKDIGYRKNIPMMSHFLELRDQGKLNSVQNIWFGKKMDEELYDCKRDPHNIHNLIDEPEYGHVLTEMRSALFSHLQESPDLGQIPEAELIDMMWPNFEQPTTVATEIRFENNKVALASKTKGASIAYYISSNADEQLDFNSGWHLYTHPLEVEKGKFIYTMAQRIGYKESTINMKQIQ